jgi:hypothetical protein
MKTTTALLAVAFVAAMSTSAVNAATVSYTANSQSLSGSDKNFSLTQFDVTLGTLTGVRIFTSGGTINGVLMVTNNDATSVSIEEYTATITARGIDANLGYTTATTTLDPVSTSPPMIGASIPGLDSGVFTAADNFAPIADQSISSGNWAAYQGSGSVTFKAKVVHSLTLTGSNFALNTSQLIVPFNFGVEYTYTPAVSPIPEPSSVLGLGLLISSGIFMRSRRKARGTSSVELK